MECACGLQIERLIRDPNFESFRSFFDWENRQSGVITCNGCNTTVATGEKARRYQSEEKLTQELNEKAERMARDLTQREAANPPRCQYCLDDGKALRRPDVDPNHFELTGDYSPGGAAEYVCRCGLVVGNDRDFESQSSWIDYFF